MYSDILKDPAKTQRNIRSAPWGNFGPGTPNPIVGFRPVLAPASKLPEANIPEDERVVSL